MSVGIAGIAGIEGLEGFGDSELTRAREELAVARGRRADAEAAFGEVFQSGGGGDAAGLGRGLKLAQEREGLLAEEVALRVQIIEAGELIASELTASELGGSGDNEEGRALVALAESEIESALARLGVLLGGDGTGGEDEAGVVILELRAGAGGEEAALFAATLERMYQRFAEARDWEFTSLDRSYSDLGGLREGVFRVRGKGVRAILRFESGVHRVQRVPTTEASGRIHTSTATVAVLPEVDAVEVEIRSEDLRIDTYRASGAGGQHVNRTDSAVRITHVPSGIVAQCQDEKSQHRNRARALEVLRARLYASALSQAAGEEHALRRNQIGTADRSERIRTYNYPQNRITDHRISFSLNRLDAVLEGGALGEIVAALSEAARRLEREEERGV